ncbi:N-acetylglucosamine-6-phosphate deacetylase [Limnochorda pilosa]|uniref:N-acetylglucosamine-6-phosphate deacetylase n=1 Tax=Limnochorda pilosa TaxID=1555112 RepID=A0A0K2SJ56_LIMPI|nr:N-acetylglucosamine-6-phosphate deacetylase [Limnochorda pilosa]BAS27138.1 N-acetylglucosamine-6-phosphate deacetylase [Limnochorda pilosa]
MSGTTAWLIRGAKVLAEDGWDDGAVLAVVAGRIAYRGDLRALPRRLEVAGTEVGRQSLEEIQAEGGYLCPGFVDIHVHGGGGADVMDASPGALRQIARTHARHGTVALLATTVSAPYEHVRRVMEAVQETSDGLDEGSEILGVHLEGPHLSPRRAGAQNPEYLTPPDPRELEALMERFPGLLAMVTLAPELDGASELIELLHRSGVVPAVGHSDATYEQAVEAFQHGAQHAVHTFNGMNPLHHRAPGVPGAVITTRPVTAELIADGFHVHPGVARLLWQVKGPDRLVLVTDAMRATDLPDGRYELGGLEVEVHAGAARLAGSETLAGSTLTLERAVRWMANEVGVPLADAVRLASQNPARRLGLGDRLGSLEVGKDGSVVLLDGELRVRLTLHQGWVLYDGQGSEYDEAEAERSQDALGDGPAAAGGLGAEPEAEPSASVLARMEHEEEL